MAAFEHIQNMYDIAFKPRLLRSLVREHLPDEKHTFKGPLELSHVVSMVKTHQLLSETEKTNSKDPKLMESWKAAIDVWVKCVLELASSNMPDKCWAGICLLGLTCQECISERFLASYSEWLQKLHMHIQPPADSHFVKVASCASLSDVFTRMGRLPRVKKDANSQAAKFVQPVLKLLNEDSSEAVWEGAVGLLCTLITYYPSSIQRIYDKVEAAVVSKIMSGNCSSKMLKKLGHCFALLPKSRGDEESWSLMMHKILYALNVHLNDVFQGVEEVSKSDEALRLLVPLGKDPPPPLGGCTIGDASDQKIKKTERLHISSISALMHCCCLMLTNTYPVQAKVPVRSLVVLLERVLMVDGSSSQASYHFMTSMQQELICSELPILHLYSLELLKALIKSVRSQLLPLAAEIVGLLKAYFKRCLLPHLRIEVYAVIRTLLMSMGVGVAAYLAQEVVTNAFIDLDMDVHVALGASSNANAKVPNEPLQPCRKKRKHGKTKGSVVEQPNQEVGPTKSPTPLALKIAALEALESVLTVAGALGAESWRPSVDRLITSIATSACKGGWGKELNHLSTLNELVPTMADFQLVALKSLLASLLSPARYRPPHLAQGLDLFRRGMRETGTKLGEFCSHALLALEVLIHPRALPLIDYSSPSATSFDVVDNRFGNAYTYAYKQDHTPFSSNSLEKRPDKPEIVEDDLYKSWLEVDDDDLEIQRTQVRTNDKNLNDKFPARKQALSPEKIEGNRNNDMEIQRTEVSGNDKIPTENFPEKIKFLSPEKTQNEKSEGKRDENMLDDQQFREPIEVSTQPIDRVIVDKLGADQIENEKTRHKVDLIANDVVDVGTSSVFNSARFSAMERNFNYTVEGDSDIESLPDIVEDEVSESE